MGIKIIRSFFVLCISLIFVFLISCENNLLEILGRDVFFATVVDPFSIAIDFEYVGEYPVNQNSPIYLGILPIPFPEDNDVDLLGLVTTVAKITTPNRQTITILRDKLNSVFSQNNQYVFIYLHDIDGNYSTNTPQINYYYNQADAIPENYPRNGTPDFVGVLNHSNGGFVGFQLSDLFDFEDLSIRADAIFTSGNVYRIRASEIIILPDEYEYDNTLDSVYDPENVPLVPSEGSLVFERTLHRRRNIFPPGDNDYLVFTPSTNGTHTISISLDSLTSGLLDSILESDSKYQFVYRPLIVQLQLGKIESETNEDSISNWTTNTLKTKYYMTDATFHESNLTIGIQEITIDTTPYDREEIFNPIQLSFTQVLNSDSHYAIFIRALSIDLNNATYALTGNYKITISDP